MVELRSIIEEVRNEPLQKACLRVLAHPEFFVVPASLRFHHTYEGGLATHTLEVLDTALQIYDFQSERSASGRDILIAAAVWHDFKKIEEYAFVDKTWVKTPYISTVGHICGSAAHFYAVAHEFKVPRVLREAIHHAILAHHGPVKEWGSPVAPQTLEALILHQADILSAHYGRTK